MTLKDFFDEAGYTGKILNNEPMSRHTSLGIGGPAEAMCFPAKTEELARMLALAGKKGVPVFILGNGTNLLVLDGGIPGVVINMRGMDWLELERGELSTAQVHAGAGLQLIKLIAYCAENGYSGMEFAAGIPGTIGGAVVMNAGTQEAEMRNVLTSVTLVASDGTVSKLPASGLEMKYRNGGVPEGSVVAEASVAVIPWPREEIKEKVAHNVIRRKNSQPTGVRSCGSTFKNPPGYSAWKLIEMAGMKETMVGGAAVSRKHANFLINTGKATAHDYKALMDLVSDKVYEKLNIRLEPEVRVVGVEKTQGLGTRD